MSATSQSAGRTGSSPAAHAEATPPPRSSRSSNPAAAPATTRSIMRATSWPASHNTRSTNSTNFCTTAGNQPRGELPDQEHKTRTCGKNSARPRDRKWVGRTGTQTPPPWKLQRRKPRQPRRAHPPWPARHRRKLRQIILQLSPQRGRGAGSGGGVKVSDSPDCLRTTMFNLHVDRNG